MKTIILECPFQIGNIIEPIVNELYDSDESVFFTVVGYEIISVTDGIVSAYLVKVQSQMAEVIYFYPNSIKIKNDK